MTINAGTRKGKRYIERHGPFLTSLDGVDVTGVWYVDFRRRIAKAYVKGEDSGYKLGPDGRIATETICCKTIKIRRVESWACVTNE